MQPRLLVATALALLVAAPVAQAQQDPQAPPPADAQQAQQPADLQEALAHFNAGKDAFARADYATAVNEFKAAQQIKFSPKLDFNIAGAYEKLGNHPHTAAAYFRRY